MTSQFSQCLGKAPGQEKPRLILLLCAIQKQKYVLNPRVQTWKEVFCWFTLILISVDMNFHFQLFTAICGSLKGIFRPSWTLLSVFPKIKLFFLPICSFAKQINWSCFEDYKFSNCGQQKRALCHSFQLSRL